MRTLVHVEGMSFDAMATGIRWGFESFPENRDPLLTAETHHGSREKFVLYVEDLDAMQAALGSAPAPFRWRLRNP